MQQPTTAQSGLIILFLIFALLENYILPLLIIADVNFTVGNPEIAAFFDLKPSTPAPELFGFGFSEIITWLIQSLLAALIGEKIIMKKTKTAVLPKPNLTRMCSTGGQTFPWIRIEKYKIT